MVLENNIIILWAWWPQSLLHMQALAKEGISFSGNTQHRLVWCVNPDTDLAKWFLAEHSLGDIPVAWDMTHLLAALWDKKDRVTCIVNTPVNTHTKLLHVILDLHKQWKLSLAGVICEKLLGRNVNRAIATTETYEQQGISLGVVCQKYFSSWVLLAQKLLADVDVFNETFRTHFSSGDVTIAGVEVYFEKDRTQRSLRVKTNNLHHGKAPWTHFELPHMAAIVDAILGEIWTLQSIDGQDMKAKISDVRAGWIEDHAVCVHWDKVIIKNHAGWTATTLAWDKRVALHSSLVSPTRRREVVIRLANGHTLHIHLDPGETKNPESRLELKNVQTHTLWITERETDNSLGVCLKAMLDAIASGTPIPSNARRHIGLLQFLDDADKLLGVE